MNGAGHDGIIAAGQAAQHSTHPLNVRCHFDGWRQLVSVVQFDVLGIAGIEQESGDRTKLRRCRSVSVAETEPISLSSAGSNWTIATNPGGWRVLVVSFSSCCHSKLPRRKACDDNMDCVSRKT